MCLVSVPLRTDLFTSHSIPFQRDESNYFEILCKVAVAVAAAAEKKRKENDGRSCLFVFWQRDKATISSFNHFSLNNLKSADCAGFLDKWWWSSVSESFTKSTDWDVWFLRRIQTPAYLYLPFQLSLIIIIILISNDN